MKPHYWLFVGVFVFLLGIPSIGLAQGEIAELANYSYSFPEEIWEYKVVALHSLITPPRNHEVVTHRVRCPHFVLDADIVEVAEQDASRGLFTDEDKTSMLHGRCPIAPEKRGEVSIDPRRLEASLNRLGRDGWSLVTVIQGDNDGIAIFKRKITPYNPFKNQEPQYKLLQFF